MKPFAQFFPSSDLSFIRLFLPEAEEEEGTNQLEESEQVEDEAGMVNANHLKSGLVICI